MTTPKMTLPEWAAGQDQPWTSVNEALRHLDVIGQLSVISDSLATPPVAPDDGDCYIVAAAATGAWAGWEGQLAAWIANVWVKITPKEGWSARVQSARQNFVWETGAWVTMDAPSDGKEYCRRHGQWSAITYPADMHPLFLGNPSASQIIWIETLGRTTTFPANFVGSVGKVLTPPAASYAIDVQVDGVSIGTITISTLGAMSFMTSGSTSKTVNAGATITLVTPTLADAAINGINATITATTDGSTISSIWQGASRWRILTTATQNQNVVAIATLQMMGLNSSTNIAVGGVATASSQWGAGMLPAYAFDNDPVSIWSSGAGDLGSGGAWIEYAFPSSVNLASISIQARNNSSSNQAPKDFTIEYWDGTNWVVAKAITGEIGWAPSEIRTFII